VLTAACRRFTLAGSSVDAVDDVNLSIAAGEHVVVTGPSGAGKSTLLGLIGGLDRATSGTVEVAGKDLARMRSDELARYRRETVGFVFQTFHLLPDLTALENAALPRVLGGATQRQAQHLAGPLLEQVGLGGRLGHRPSQLSAGEQQRVALARALANQPRVLLADEPTANLDADAARTLIELIASLRARHSLTVVLATHDPALTAGAERVFRMAHGRLM